MQTLNIIAGILVTLIGLGFIICMHELGHFLFAKRFGVYCYEFSIGFGPKIFSKRKKGHETKFSVRWILLGGYVSMAGEEDEEEAKNPQANTEIDEPVVPPERTVGGIKTYKQIIVFLAGVFINFILAFALFLVKNTTTVYVDMNSTRFKILDNTPMRTSGFYNGDVFSEIVDISFSNPTMQEQYDNLTEEVKTTYFVKPITNYNDMGLTTLLKDQNDKVVFDFTPTSESDSITRTFKAYRVDVENNYSKKEVTYSVTQKAYGTENNNTTTYSYQIMGISPDQYYLNFGQAIAQSFIDFGESIAAVCMGIAQLFTPGGLRNIGGLIAIAKINTDLVSAGSSFGNIIYLFGLISANLGVLNLIPFPGLDGWQATLAMVEGIRKKKLSFKFKSTANRIGMLILLGLGVVIIILDIVRYII